MAYSDSIVGQIGDLAEAGERMIERLRRKAFLPDSRKGLHIRFGIAETAQLLGCSTNRNTHGGRRWPATPLHLLGKMADGSVTRSRTPCTCARCSMQSPARGPKDTPAIIAVQNFKGGVGKSTVTTHLAHYFAVQGYRVLVVDCDSQATTTTLFGFNPHFNITREETLYPYLSIDPTQADLLYAVKGTSLAEC